jgi:hypothetical protein
VKDSKNTISPSSVLQLLQVKEDSNKVLAKGKGILCAVFHVHQAVKDRSVVSESTMGIGEKVSALLDPDEMTVHYALCLT